MNIRSGSIVVFLGVLAAVGIATSAIGANLPAAFAREGKVCNSSQAAGSDHKHELASWKVKAGESKVALLERPSGTSYIDILGGEASELRSADFLIVNESSDPVYSKEEYPEGCKRNVKPKAFTVDVDIPDFVFAFAVANVLNATDAVEKSSPHAIVYLPINIGQSSRNEAQEFQILLFHMQPSENDCPVAPGEDREQCRALWELRTLSEKGGYTEVQMKETVALRIRRVLKVGAPIPNPPPSRNRNSYRSYFLSESRYHNGVIHGTF